MKNKRNIKGMNIEMEIVVQVYENSELIDTFIENAESIDVLSKETMKTNKKNSPYIFEKANGDTWVIFKKDNKYYRLQFSYHKERYHG